MTRIGVLQLMNQFEDSGAASGSRPACNGFGFRPRGRAGTSSTNGGVWFPKRVDRCTGKSARL